MKAKRGKQTQKGTGMHALNREIAGPRKEMGREGKETSQKVGLRRRTRELVRIR
jgi:hypothetical protein